jgi:hypothetical protein
MARPRRASTHHQPMTAPNRCPICSTVLVVREGKSGKFICCPKSYKGNNHGTWPFMPEAPMADERPRGSAHALRALVEDVNRRDNDPDSQFLGVTQGVADCLDMIVGHSGGEAVGDIFCDPGGHADYIIAEMIYGDAFEDGLDPFSHLALPR